MANRDSQEAVLAKPFLKWAGGKRLILPALKKSIGKIEGRFIEPFLGGGSVLFSMDQNVEILAADLNAELINTYLTVRDKLDKLEPILASYFDEFFDPEIEQQVHFEKIKCLDRDPLFSRFSAEERAARFLYLNKVSFNGLYRVNSKGHFNVPMGKSTSGFQLDFSNLRIVSKFLSQKSPVDRRKRRIHLENTSFEKLLSKAQERDTIYLDPPYDFEPSNKSFVSYQKAGFTREDQLSLKNEMVRLAGIGCKVVQSNADTTYIRKLYSNTKIFKMEEVLVPRFVGAKSSSRVKAKELIISTLPNN